MAPAPRTNEQRNRGFDDMYQGTPPWEIDRPQPFLLDAIAAGDVQGHVLDVGCGTGENTLAIAASGATVTGIDVSPRAIDKARAKAEERHVQATFEVADVFTYTPTRPYDGIVDSAIYHIFPDDDRARYVQRLRSWLAPGGLLLLACFSDREPTDWGGPRRIHRHELEASFGDWNDLHIETGRYAVNLPEVTGHAWIVRARA